ncbi:hypothetical protein PPERSA_09012 [Pseudocohnilembus persalinus]|uniref:Uncharacterized protein n=1 Tax=Pseudocohnilembus persalinus TaxID=266149 RepID=A0A0V0R314_PSEPJ|nr:hypothetical protein PPERSA_09012 [Pseudocohnilembus persalinus]|eukprot:KRX08908.1 hypothetical protein PPERSA_09012 [Pseudocohnilembus persalinus]
MGKQITNATQIGGITLSKGAYMTLMKRKNQKGIPIQNSSQSFSCQTSPNIVRTASRYASCQKKAIDSANKNLNSQIFMNLMSSSQKKKAFSPKQSQSPSQISHYKPIQKQQKNPKNQQNSISILSKSQYQQKQLQKRQTQKKKSQQTQPQPQPQAQNPKHSYQKRQISSKYRTVLDKENNNPNIKNANSQNSNTYINNNTSTQLNKRSTSTKNNNNINYNNTQTYLLRNSNKNQQFQRQTNSTSKNGNYSHQQQQLIQQQQINQNKCWHKPTKDMKISYTYFKPPVFFSDRKKNQNQNQITHSNNQFKNQFVQQRKLYQGYECKFVTRNNEILAFNCFKEKDLKIPKEYSQLIDNQIDNDMETDDEQKNEAIKNVFINLCQSIRDEQVEDQIFALIAIRLFDRGQ